MESASPTRFPEVKKSEAMRRKSNSRGCLKVSQSVVEMSCDVVCLSCDVVCLSLDVVKMSVLAPSRGSITLGVTHDLTS